MEIIPDIQAKLTASSGKVHLSNESIDSICQRVKCETEQIKLPTELLRKTIPQIVGRKNGYSMSGEPTGIDDNDSFFSDPWIDLLSNNRQDLLTTRMHESITRLMHHQEDLSRWFNTPVRNISNIQISESETHNNGRCLAIYTVDDNSKIVYKPVCLRIVKLFGDIVHDVLGDDSNIIKVPRCYPVGNDYGFMEYLVKSKAIADEETLKRFYYRAGVVLSFAYALRITDLHDGNLIASGEFPVVFDLETSFYQFPNNLDFTDVRDTGMIGNKGSSGIEGGGSSWDWQPRVESAAHGHPVLRYTKKIWFDDNRLYDGPGLADPYQYCDEVVKGFQHGYQAILGKRSMIVERLEQARQEDGMRVRHLVRHTAYYNLLLAWLRQPVVNPGATRQDEVLEDLYKNYLMDHPLSEGVYTAEFDDLLNGDIPYFWTSFDSYDLEHSSGIVQEGYFKETSYQVACRHLDRMSIADMDNQVQIIYKSMGGSHA